MEPPVELLLGVVLVGTALSVVCLALGLWLRSRSPWWLLITPVAPLVAWLWMFVWGMTYDRGWYLARELAWSAVIVFVLVLLTRAVTSVTRHKPGRGVSVIVSLAASAAFLGYFTYLLISQASGS